MLVYSKIFYENIIIGAQVGSGVVISCILTQAIPLNKYPLFNRVTEVGLYNVIQNEYVNTGLIPFSNIDYTANFLYRGVFQGVKWIPNLWIQNQAKEYFYDDPAKAFIIPFIGMTAFFTIGATEAIIITNKANKFIFTLTSTTLLATISSFYSAEETIKTNTGAIHLSPQDTNLAQEGLIIAFLLMDIAHFYKLPGTLKPIMSLPLLTATTLATNEFYKFITDENATLSNIASNIASELIKIAAFSLAKAVAVTGTQIASDYVIAPVISMTPSYTSYLQVIEVLLYEGYNIYDLTVNNEFSFYEALYIAVSDISAIAVIPVMMMGIDLLL